MLGVVAALALPAAAARAEEQDGITFRFAPPPGTRGVQELTSTRVQVFKGLGTRTEETVSRTDLVYEATDEGWLMRATPTLLRTTRDGREHANPIVDSMLGAELVYRIDLEGGVTGIEGYEEVIRKMLAGLPPEAAAGLAEMLTPESLEAKDMAEFSGRISDWAGLTFESGEIVELEVPFTLPDGTELIYQTRTRIGPRVAHEGTDCVRVTTVYDSNESAMDNLMNRAMKGVVRGFLGDPEAIDLTIGGMSVRGSAERLIDPETMLIHAETAIQEMRFSMEVPGRGKVPSSRTETKVYKFTYKSAGKAADGG